MCNPVYRRGISTNLHNNKYAFIAICGVHFYFLNHRLCSDIVIGRSLVVTILSVDYYFLISTIKLSFLHFR